MSISLTHTPEDYDFCDNPVAFKLYSNAYLVSAGTASKQWLTKNGIPAVDDTISMSFLGYELVFTFKTTPDSSGLQLSAGGTINTLATELDANYYLHKYYDISVQGTTNVELLAKESGTDLIITFDIDCSAYTSSNQVAGTNRTYLENFKLFLNLFVEKLYGTDVFSSVAEAFMDPDSTFAADFYFGQILKRLYPVFEPQNFGYLALHLCTSPILKYYIEYAEYFGEDPVVKKIITSDEYKCFNGKLKADKWIGHDFYDDIKTSKLLLTNIPLKSFIWKEAHGYIHFFNTQSKTESFTVTYESKNTDGSSNSAISKNIVNVPDGSIFGIPIGADLLSIGTTGKDLYKFSIQVKITSDETIVSELYSFYIINRPFNPVNILYKNEYGVLDTLLCENLQLNIKTDKTTSEIFQTYNYSLLQGNIKNQIKSSELTFKASTGFLQADQAHHLIELLEGGYAFMVGKTKYLKIGIVAGSFNMIKQSGDLQQFEFSFRLASSGTISTEELNL